MPEHPRQQTPKINFWLLFEVFPFKVIKHFLITTFKTVVLTILLATIANLFQKELIPNGFDYKELFPELVKKLIDKRLDKEEFIIWSLIMIALYALAYYFDNLLEEELMVRGERYVKERLLTKFRNLPFEEREARKSEIITLAEAESKSIGWYWEHLYNHVYHSVLSIILILLVDQDKFFKMGEKEKGFSFIWLSLICLITYLFTRLVLSNEKKYKKAIEKENHLINKETNKNILIDSMGLLPEYKLQQVNIMDKNVKLRLGFDRTKSLSKAIPNKLLIEVFPFLLLFLSKDFVGRNLFTLWEIYGNVAEIFTCLWDYSDYASSLIRINNFLQLPEKNDNLRGLQLKAQEEIKNITYQNVSFHYANSNNLIIENYNYTFDKGNINKLSGENGTGKSTILYLLLGMLKPSEGKILIHCESGKVYNLHQDINLQHWREKKIAYCSHDNLIEEGSTGQRQLANINKILALKKEAKIFIFDEATNALDKEKQAEVEKRLEKLAKEDKIIIYTKH